MLAAYGVKVALAARRLERLEEVKKEIENGKGSKKAIARVFYFF